MRKPQPVPLGYQCRCIAAPEITLCYGKIHAGESREDKQADIWRCKKCGTAYAGKLYESRASKLRASSKLRSIPPPRLPDLEQHLGETCRLLGQLKPPFTHQVDLLGNNTINATVPVFAFRMTNHWEEHSSDGFMSRWNQIEARLHDLPLLTKSDRLSLLRILKACDARLRIATQQAQETIRNYQKIIQQEEANLHARFNQDTLFPLSRTPADTHIKEQVTTAACIIQSAKKSLAPCVAVYLNRGRGSRRITLKLWLCHILSKHMNPTAVSKLVSELLTLADPRRPAAREAIRQAHLKSSRSKRSR